MFILKWSISEWYWNCYGASWRIFLGAAAACACSSSSLLTITIWFGSDSSEQQCLRMAGGIVTPAMYEVLLAHFLGNIE